jgi:hypothetical protein
MSEPGIKVLGSTPPAEATEPAPPAGRTAFFGRMWVVSVLLVLALAGVAGTITFGILWAGLQSKQNGETTARSVASRFVYDFTNFDSSSVDKTFVSLQQMATGQFASQAKAQFTPQLEKELQAADATTRGQVQYLYVQSYAPPAASFYADVRQTYANDKTTAPQADELRLVIDLKQVGSQWKVSDVTSLGTAATLGG